MIKEVIYVEGNTLKKFFLDRPQPYKDPRYMDFPVEGTLVVSKIKNGRPKPVEKSHIKVRNILELTKIMH